MAQPAFVHLTWESLRKRSKRTRPSFTATQFPCPYKTSSPGTVSGTPATPQPMSSSPSRRTRVPGAARSSKRTPVPRIRLAAPHLGLPAQLEDPCHLCRHRHPRRLAAHARYPLRLRQRRTLPRHGGRHGRRPRQAQRMADLISECYIAFARVGKPDNAHAPHWPAFDLKQRGHHDLRSAGAHGKRSARTRAALSRPGALRGSPAPDATFETTAEPGGSGCRATRSRYVPRASTPQSCSGPCPCPRR